MKRRKKAVNRDMTVRRGRLLLHVAPEAGSVVLFEGRPLVFLHQDVCLSRTGNEFDALHWHTLCAVCGVEFPFRTILGTASTVTKRCEIHRNAGKLPPVPDPLPIYMVDPVTRSISEIPHPKNCEATNEPA